MTTLLGMSDSDAKVYQFIRDYIAEHHRSPSQREIVQGCFLNAATVVRYLDRLQANGWIDRIEGQARSIILCDPPPTKAKQAQDGAEKDG